VCRDDPAGERRGPAGEPDPPADRLAGLFVAGGADLDADHAL
jgi:hypothetical protein